MANVQVKNSLTNTKAAKRTRYEKMEVAYGKILAADFAADDTLSFDQIPMLNLVHAKFVASEGFGTLELELFHGADLTNPITWDIVNNGDTADISYVISYVRGTGKLGANADQGKLLQLTINSSND